MDCDYYWTGGYSRPIGEILSPKGWIDYITFCIKDKNQSICGFDSYLISVDSKRGIVKQIDLELIRNYIGVGIDLSLVAIESLYEILKENPNLDLSELEKILFFHQTDIEFRKKIIDMINLALIYSKI